MCSSDNDNVPGNCNPVIQGFRSRNELKKLAKLTGHSKEDLTHQSNEDYFRLLLASGYKLCSKNGCNKYYLKQSLHDPFLDFCKDYSLLSDDYSLLSDDDLPVYTKPGWGVSDGGS